MSATHHLDVFPNENATVAYPSVGPLSAASTTLNLWTDNRGNFMRHETIHDETVADMLDFKQITIHFNGSGNAVTASLEDGTPLNNFKLVANNSAISTSIITTALNTAMSQTAQADDRVRSRVRVEGVHNHPTLGTICVSNVLEHRLWGASAITEDGRSSGGDVTRTELMLGLDETCDVTTVALPGDHLDRFGAMGLASAINTNRDSEFWAMTEGDMVYVFSKEAGDNNFIFANEVAALDQRSQSLLDAINFENVATGVLSKGGTNLSLGGEFWARMTPSQAKANMGHDIWNVLLEGHDVGKERDLWIASEGDIRTPGMANEELIVGLNRESFIEVQNADNAQWAGAEVRTQSSAQEALDALTEAIIQKDKTRADIGALQNRLENTMTNLEIQAENLLSSESRISDADVAKEMTEFTKNNVLVQAATSMLSQANGMSQMALSLMG